MVVEDVIVVVVTVVAVAVDVVVMHVAQSTGHASCAEAPNKLFSHTEASLPHDEASGSPLHVPVVVVTVGVEKRDGSKERREVVNKKKLM